MEKIQFTVGDWSGDGHNEKKDFFVLSSVPVQDLRELHYLAKSVVGFEIGSICGDYDEHDLDKGIREHLTEIGVLSEHDKDMTEMMQPEDVMEIWVRVLRYIAEDKGIPLTLTRILPGTPSALPIDALRTLMKRATKDGLKAEITVNGEVPADPADALFSALSDAARAQGGSLGVLVTGPNVAKIPTMHFYGFDEKNRHLDTPGYGAFYF